MTISSYSLVLMVIHFLQYAVQPCILPCLHSMYPDKFQDPFYHRVNDITSIDMCEELEPFESQNKQTLGELFVEFLGYYSNFRYVGCGGVDIGIAKFNGSKFAVTTNMQYRLERPAYCLLKNVAQCVQQKMRHTPGEISALKVIFVLASFLSCTDSTSYTFPVFPHIFRITQNHSI